MQKESRKKAERRSVKSIHAAAVVERSATAGETALTRKSAAREKLKRPRQRVAQLAGSGWRKGCGSLFFLWVNFTGRPGNRVYAGANGLAILPSTVRRHSRRTTCRRHGMQRPTRGPCGDSRERPALTSQQPGPVGSETLNNLYDRCLPC